MLGKNKGKKKTKNIDVKYAISRIKYIPNDIKKCLNVNSFKCFLKLVIKSQTIFIEFIFCCFLRKILCILLGDKKDGISSNL